MNCIPDILGMELETAQALLHKEGLVFSVLETKPHRPPREVYKTSKQRVIKVEDLRQNKAEGKVESSDILITVCKI